MPASPRHCYAYFSINSFRFHMQTKSRKFFLPGKSGTDGEGGGGGRGRGRRVWWDSGNNPTFCANRLRLQWKRKLFMEGAKNITTLQSRDWEETTVMLFLYQSQFSVGEEWRHIPRHVGDQFWGKMAGSSFRWKAWDDNTSWTRDISFQFCVNESQFWISASEECCYWRMKRRLRRRRRKRRRGKRKRSKRTKRRRTRR